MAYMQQITREEYDNLANAIESAIQEEIGENLDADKLCEITNAILDIMKIKRW